MSVSNQDWREEQRRIDQVTDEIDRRMADLLQKVDEKKAHIVDMRKNFWDDVKLNFDEPDEAMETAMSIKQQAEVLSERERSHRHFHQQLKTLTKLKQSPYFGRIDFTEEGEGEAERIYIGIASFLDESEERFLIYDWRAPVSSLYYDYSPGPAQYVTPGGIISGTMELKRQFMIRDGRMDSMFDTGVTIGDELLKEVLGRQANTQMKSIVATIQKEQNRIIRNERSRLLIVQGAAGSGKTSAALQRVAYLLYRYRESLRADQIILFSPNPMFNSYVANVLPELGEENMQQTTFQHYLEHRLGASFQLEDPFTQMEYVLAAVDDPGYAVRLEGIWYKASADFMRLVDEYVVWLGQEGLVFKDIVFRGAVLISAERIKEQFYTFHGSISLPQRMALISEWLLKQLKKHEQKERTKPWVGDEIELLDEEAYLQAYRALQRKNQFTDETFDDFDRERQWLASYVVKKRFAPLRKHVEQLGFIDVPAIYKQLFNEPTCSRLASGDQLPRHWAAICEQTVDRLNRAELAYEDATPYLYLQERIAGFQTNTSVRHVLIDEAQDYSPFQFAFIQKLFPRSKMTVLGDFNQAIYTHTAESNSFEALAKLYGTDETETVVLTRSYRSTRQIVEFTRALINGGEAIEPFNREGEKPTLTQATNLEELVTKVSQRIRELQAAQCDTVAIICKTATESREAYEALQNNGVILRLIGKETAAFEAGVLVIPSYLAKGVEFDAVIIYDSSQYSKESERKLFYTACTRAMHALHIYGIGQMNPFISSVPADAYVTES